MRLNHDCIRDILLYIEKNTTDEIGTIDAETLISDLSCKYDEGTINYHVRQIHKANLVDDVFYADDVPDTICGLSWDGHCYMDNIRDNKVWDKLKELSEGVSSIGLPVLIEYAKREVLKFLPKF